MDWLNFGNFQDNNGVIPIDSSMGKQEPVPDSELHQNLSDYMKATHPVQNKDDTQKYLNLFGHGGSSYDPNSSAWYNQGMYAHKQGSSLTSLIGMLVGA